MGMSPEDFRRWGHVSVDWVAGYLTGVGNYPVLPDARPGTLVDRLPAAAPESGEPFETIFEDFRNLIVANVTHWNHPRFFAYFANSGTPPAILAELFAAALNLNGMLWKSAPALTELEQVTLDWLRQWLGLPEGFFGIIYDTASTSTLHAIVAAREAADPGARERGANPNLVLYCSEHAHSAADKGAITAGIGHSNVRKIASDDRFRMRADALEAAIQEDLRAGRRPFCVIATVGTTSTASVDPVPAIADIAQRYKIWLHVDAAYAGPAAITASRRWIMDGVDRADSLVLNPHKWLLTPTDLSAFYTRRPDILRRAFSLVPEFLRTEENPRAVNLMDYGFQLGRRFRALKLWFVMRAYGRQGLAEVIESHCRMAQEFAGWVTADARFEVCAPVDFSLVCFRLRESDDANRRLLERINLSGVAFLSHTVLNGRFTLRLAIGNFQTTREDLRLVWEDLAAVDGEAEGGQGRGEGGTGG